MFNIAAKSDELSITTTQYVQKNSQNHSKILTKCLRLIVWSEDLKYTLLIFSFQGSQK